MFKFCFHSQRFYNKRQPEEVEDRLMVTCLCVSMAFPYLLFFLLPFFSSAVFTPADNYLLSCGSITNTTLSDGSDTRSFIPDTSSSSKLSISIDGSISFTSPDITRNSTSDLYRTARFFSKQSSYTFQISKQGTHVVRLHFYPFSTPTHDLFSSVFDVSASDFPLLTSFSLRSTSDPLVVKEFYLSINITYFTLSFSPSGFVNAIEVFSAPDDLVQDTVMLVVPMAENRTLDGVSGQVLETVYRINVGGEKVTPVNDSLWRTWIPDWNFLRTKTLAMPVPFARVAYQQGFGPSVEIAPMLVYGTAREMNKSGNSSSSNSNLIWGFPVSSNQRYLVRMHFCDIVSPALNDLYFNTYISNHSVMTDLDLSTQTTLQLRAPFYSDSIVDTNGVSQLVVGVGPSAQTQADEKNAILNGLEIMKLNGAALLSESCPKKSNLGFVVSVVVGSLAVVGIVVLLLMLVLCTRTWKKHKKLPPEGSLWVMVPGNSSLGGRTTVNSPLPDLNLNLRIPFADILLATNNFDRENEIGSGGFGKVYKGLLKDGMKVAVKRASRGASQGMAEFYTEVMVLSKIRHRHLVPLIGYCEERGEMILVYEFMEKGTLRSHLYGPDKITRSDLSWKQRLQMCIGSARGLHYLHTGSASQGVIHRDVKSANILLNENWVAKVADFGLSKLGPLLNQTHVSTTVKGSFGYLDPEYFRTQQLTDKSDVYSFGVVLLEVLCARGAIDRSLPYEQQNLAEWGLKKLQEGEIEQIVDPALHGSINPNSLRKYGEIIEKCLEKYGVDRPTMGDVLWNLEYALKLQEIEMQDEPNEDNGLSSVSAELAPGVYAVRSGLPTPNHRQGTISSMEVDRRETRPTNPYEDSQVSNSQAFSQLITNRGR